MICCVDHHGPPIEPGPLCGYGLQETLEDGAGRSDSASGFSISNWYLQHQFFPFHLDVLDRLDRIPWQTIWQYYMHAVVPSHALHCALLVHFFYYMLSLYTLFHVISSHHHTCVTLSPYTEPRPSSSPGGLEEFSVRLFFVFWFKVWSFPVILNLTASFQNNMLAYVNFDSVPS